MFAAAYMIGRLSLSTVDKRQTNQNLNTKGRRTTDDKTQDNRQRDANRAAMLAQISRPRLWMRSRSDGMGLLTSGKSPKVPAVISTQQRETAGDVR